MKISSLFFALALIVNAQETLTNETIVKMVKTGLGEGLIISMVQSQPGRYSLTPDELVKLKQQGVSEKVLTAMVNKGSTTNGLAGNSPSGATPGTAVAVTGDPNDPMTPHDSGIYLYTKDANGNPKMIVLERAAYQGSKTGTVGLALTGGLKKAKTKAVIAGPRASIRSSEGSPDFYFYFEDKAAGLGKSYFGVANVSNPNQFALLKLEVAKSNRETVILEANIFGASSGTNEKSMVGFKSERIRAGLYKVAINNPLQPGEYCFLASAGGLGAFGAGAAGAADIFDFGINPNQ